MKGYKAAFALRVEREMSHLMQRLSEVGTGLRGIGTSMFTGTRELLEHVTEAISSELDSIEGMAARNKPQHSRSGSRQAPVLLLWQP